MSTHVLSGIDLVEVERFQQLDEAIRVRFFERVFTHDERNHIGNSLQRAAGLFAAKEAAVKMLGCGIGPVGWQDVSVNINADGKPELVFKAYAAELVRQLGLASWSLSITHTKGHAAAVVVALKD